MQHRSKLFRVAVVVGVLSIALFAGVAISTLGRHIPELFGWLAWGALMFWLGRRSRRVTQ